MPTLAVHVGTDSDEARLRARLTAAGLPFVETRRSSVESCSLDTLWRGMPEYVNDAGILTTFKLTLSSPAAWAKAASVVRQDVSRQRDGEISSAVWYPPRERRDLQSQVYTTATPVQPRYPVYIISKGRADTRLTAKALEAMKVRYRIVIEPQERAAYAAVLPHERLLVMPDRLANLGQGSIPARNFVWDHARASGAKRHWILDDNIRHFYRRNRNAKNEVLSGVIFKAAEDFVDRFANVPIAGFQYDFFVPDTGGCRPAVSLNTRVYSCLLIDHHQINHIRWRGKYNEDTDLCLRVLKAGYCTMLINAFLQKKVATMVMKGGNTDSLYKKGRLKFVKSLLGQHGDVARHVTRYGRDHHQVDYTPFKDIRPVLRKGVAPESTVNNYGMRLTARPEELYLRRASPQKRRSPPRRSPARRSSARRSSRRASRRRR